MTDSQLIRYDAMCRAIDAAYEVDEVKDIRDKAVALEMYSRLAHNTENERRACEIRLRAERKAGKLLSEMEKAKAGRPPKIDNPGSSISRNAPTLSERGITPKQSSDWQKLAAVPEQQFEAALADPTAKPTTAGIIRANAEPKPKVTPVGDDALWLWGWLGEFERWLEKDFGQMLTTMTPQMLDDVHRLVPRVMERLSRIGMPKNGPVPIAPEQREEARKAIAAGNVFEFISGDAK